ncbi:EamA family transporter RarD [Alteromonas sp. C1M14]|nr:EamA family transporter RarD [Alteromonas sp. C1M14]
MWGIAPVYFKQLQALPAIDVLMHRVVWSAVILFVLILGLKQWGKVVLAVKNLRVMRVLFVAGILLGANWLLFIWAINNDHILDASLGYYINPLINIFFGRLFLGEKLRPMQKLAVILTVVGVAVLLVSYGEFPWIALVLAITFSVYGILRKKVAVDSLPGLFIETSLMLPFALCYWVMFASDYSNMNTNEWSLNALLIAAGVVTTAPLLCFTVAARRIMYSTLGFLQYIGPSIMFALALFVYHEPMDASRFMTFGFVWFALLIFSVDSLSAYRKQRRAFYSAKAQS